MSKFEILPNFWLLEDNSEGLKVFLDNVAGKKPKNSYVEKLEEAVKEAKKKQGVEA